jgi:oligopeptide/dipeptide ABC transporter ATP-binding protein
MGALTLRAGAGAAPRAPLLEARGLCVQLRTPGGWVAAVDGLDLVVAAGETLGLVGESGCGKTLAALALMGLLPPAARLAGGSLRFAGEEIGALPESGRRRLRGSRMAMVFQEPTTCLNPVLNVQTQLTEGIRLHLGLGRAAARERALALLTEVGVPDPARRLRSFPHELSGGLRQRVMIAMALACDPDLLIADEPTTALDMTIQAQVLAKIAALQERRGLAVLLITHDLGIVAQMARRVCVMYAGQVVEEAPVEALFAAPRHPYTRGLLASLPRWDRPPALLAGIPGSVPAPGQAPAGCRFRDRCSLAEARCAQEQLLEPGGDGRRLRCWKALS